MRTALSVARLQFYDGVLLSVVGLDRDQLDRVRMSKPIVLLGERDVPDRFNHVRLANEEGARLATAHMIEHGSRRIRTCPGSTRRASPNPSSAARTTWLTMPECTCPVADREAAGPCPVHGDVELIYGEGIDR